MPRFEKGEIDVPVSQSPNVGQIRDEVHHEMSRTSSVSTGDSTGPIVEVIRDPHLLHDESGDPESFYFRYVIREPAEYRSINDNGNDVTRISEPREVMDFFLTVDGEMFYEGSGDPEGPLGFILDGPIPNYRSGIPPSQATLFDHYRSADRVTKVQLSLSDLEPGDGPDDPRNLSEGVQQLAALGENTELTVGHYHQSRDLRDVELTNELVNRGEITRVSAVHGGDSAIELSSAGWVRFHIPEDIDVPQRARIMRRRVNRLS